MNCLRTSPGTVRKPGAILRKCSAQAFWSIDGGNLYCTIAVIIGALLYRSLRGLLQRRGRPPKRRIHFGEGGGNRIRAVRAGAGFVPAAIGFGLGIDRKSTRLNSSHGYISY